MKSHLTIIAISSLALFTLCQPTRHLDYNEQVSSKHYLFLNAELAAEAITTDEAEGFFNKVQMMDMQIQMKTQNSKSLEETKRTYVKYLKSSTLDFTEEEETAIRTIMDRALMICNSISPEIFPRELFLAKTNMNHYGASVFYSRENTIFIPENVLDDNLNTEFLKSILREVFHIYSRYNYWKRIELYNEIGFEPIHPLVIPDQLRKQMLTNPDGIENYIIHNISDNKDENFSAIPILTVKSTNSYRSLSFYSNLKFSLYKVKNNKVVTNADGSSTIDMESIGNFYEQIGTNSNFIIHPDEILADNFTMLALWRNNFLTVSEMGIDSEGKSLLMAIEDKLKKKSH